MNIKCLYSAISRLVFAMLLLDTFILTAFTVGPIAAQAFVRIRKPAYEITYREDSVEAVDRKPPKEQEEAKAPGIPRLSFLLERIRWRIQRWAVPLSFAGDVEGEYYGYQSQYGY